MLGESPKVPALDLCFQDSPFLPSVRCSHLWRPRGGAETPEIHAKSKGGCRRSFIKLGSHGIWNNAQREFEPSTAVMYVFSINIRLFGTYKWKTVPFGNNKSKAPSHHCAWYYTGHVGTRRGGVDNQVFRYSKIVFFVLTEVIFLY